MTTIVIVTVVIIALIAVPSGMMQSRIRKRQEDHDPEVRQAANDFQRDIDRGRSYF